VKVAVPVYSFALVAGLAIAAVPLGGKAAGPPKMTGTGTLSSTIGGTVVNVVVVSDVVSFESPVAERTITRASIDTTASTATRRRS
jgi:hypothetical protein